MRYRIAKQRKTVDVDDYYNKKLERSWRRYEKRYDAITKKILLNADIKLKSKEISTDKTMTKKQVEKKTLSLQKAKEKLERKKVKEKEKKITWQKIFNKAKKIKQEKRKLECWKKCYTCESNDAIHWWHWIKALQHPTALIDKNIHPQCYKCNMILDGNQWEYFKRLEIDYWKEYLDWLRLEAKTWERPTIEWMLEEIEKDKKIISLLKK